MAASLPWRRDEEPAQLPRLAPPSGGVGPEDHARGFYLRSHRIRPISTINAVRAMIYNFVTVRSFSCWFQKLWQSETKAADVRDHFGRMAIGPLPDAVQADDKKIADLVPVAGCTETNRRI